MPSSSYDAAESNRGEGARLVPLAEEHLDQIAEIEERSFVSPWRRGHFRQELERGSLAWNRVLLDGDRVLAYLCMWIIDREVQINNIAVHPDRRKRGLGRRMLRAALDIARRRGCTEAVLEVRVSNQPAIELYRSEGFLEIGRRKGYYAAEDEDAILLRARIRTPGPER